VRAKTWDWFCDDVLSRFCEDAGLLMIMTRWHVEDLAGMVAANHKNVKVLCYPAFAEKDEKNRKEGDPLFPKLKSKDFLLDRKTTLAPTSWESLYQQNPIIIGGEMIKDFWWKWWEILPPIKYYFLTADTAQKTNTWNDYTVFQAWGHGIDGNIYLVDQVRAKMEAPELLEEGEQFYKKWDLKKKAVADPVLRGFHIEDKSSGTGLIQTLKRKRLKIVAIPRNVDKISRMLDCSPYIESGKVFLNKKIPDIENLMHEARIFPNGSFDDAIDGTMSAIEVAYMHTTNSLLAAMEAA